MRIGPSRIKTSLLYPISLPKVPASYLPMCANPLCIFVNVHFSTCVPVEFSWNPLGWSSVSPSFPPSILERKVAQRDIGRDTNLHQPKLIDEPRRLKQLDFQKWWGWKRVCILHVFPGKKKISTEAFGVCCWSSLYKATKKKSTRSNDVPVIHDMISFPFTPRKDSQWPP